MPTPEAPSHPSSPPDLEHTLRALPDGAPDFDRDIHCAGVNAWNKMQRRKAFAPLAANAALRVMTVPGFFWAGVIVTFALTMGGLISRVGGLTAGLITGALLLSLLIPLILWIRRRSAPKAPKQAKALVAKATDERYRLRVISTSRLIWALRNLSNQPFEPLVFPLPYAVPLKRWAAVSLWILLSAAGYIGWWWLKRHTELAGAFMSGPPQAWEVWGILALAAAPFAWMWPAYLRVSPGRIDLFRYSFLGIGTPKVTTFDVRRASILCQAHGEHAYILITPPNAPPVSIQLSRTGCKFYEVFRAVLEAARWRGDLLTLPDDELVG